jgi:hypothetical protein
VRRVLLSLVVLALASAPADAARRTIAVKIPRVTLPAGSDVELCWFVRIPSTTAFPLGKWTLSHAGIKNGVIAIHGLAYVYTGERLAEFEARQVVQSRGCLDLGPEDRDRRVLFASGSVRALTRALPTGVALELPAVPDAPGGAPAGIGVLLDVNWSNGDTRPRSVSTKLVLRRAATKRVNRIARAISDRAADPGIFVPPFGQGSTADLVDARWTAPVDSCVLGLSGQMHRRGRCLGVDLLDVGGQEKPPPIAIPNPCEQRSQLFAAVDYTDPGALGFTTPIAVRAGEALRWGCTLDNGSSVASVRLGCEETPGVTPGSVAEGPAALCTLAVPASAECPGNAACVPANAVAGPGVDDELCGLTAHVYDAAPGGGCDVSSLP